VTTVALDIATPAVFEPLLAPARYKGAKGGRGGAKSHFFGDLAVETMVTNPAHRFACIREVQRSLRFSVKSLVEAKIEAQGVRHLFEVTREEIRRVGGSGVMIFVGMQDHTAESVKSLEGFDTAWVEEAQSLSKRSLEMLTPTIRKPGSELWFSWNPDERTGPVDTLFAGLSPEPGAPAQLAEHARLDPFVTPEAILVHANYTDNPFCPDELRKEAARLRRLDPNAYAHVWLGQYNERSDAQVLAGKWVVDEFTPGEDWQGPYLGADFGFAQDPTTLVEAWTHGRTLYLHREAYKVGLELDDTAPHWLRAVPGANKYVVRADSARPESISYLKRFGVPRIEAAPKWSGSVEDGIAHLRSYDRIVIHPRCAHAQEEARLYSYKVDKRTGDILPDVVDAHNHIWDAVRYALAPIIKAQSAPAAYVF
jgi:phage terminase large subunit